jgi:carboxymethylenebutenolidase
MSNQSTASMITADSLHAYLSRPQDDGGSGMLLLPMITGIGEQLREFADDIARSGVTALSWDPWHGSSDSDTPRDELFAMMRRLDDETVLTEQRRLLDYMFSDLGLRKVGVIGWCLGGRFALLLAGRDKRLANVVAYHPTVPLPPAPNHTLDSFEYAGEIEAPVMMLYPGKDDLVPRESFDRLQTALNAREGTASIVHLYPEAEHGFTARARHDNAVNAEAYRVSWPQALAFIQETTRV